ncbi:hypothetical protein [Chamaesiphon minutus]|uniref:Uncharacterized protein n=1 Tax=Chamaesiphon minutus (strain ATCC 27169 / PCC 6605) TaxID=1173020 RepID=K9UCG0_CHAP6|nr:hypothetical protein [Chamaesiphon minutus]AFY91899.1 hypothetical protein Cha6605_0622 [Chamaesiphon minutus PCC 6605]
MKKFLTIAAVAGVLSTFAGSAQAQTVSFGGSVAPSCTFTKVIDGSLTNATGAVTSISTITPGQINVICNSDTSTLNLITVAPTVTFTGTGTIQTGTTTKVGFTSGGNGIYAGLAAYNSTTPVTATVSAGDVTKAAGDDAFIASEVNAPATKLLKAGAYSVVVTPTLTP